MLRAAREILREDDTPLDLRKVAERAGKSRTAPYLVFGKESEGGGVLALRIAVAAEGAREMARAMESAAGTIDDPIEAFHRVARAFLDFVEREPRLFRLMYGPEINAVSRLGEDGFRAHPEFSRLLKFRSLAGGVVSEVIRRGQDEAMLRPEAPGNGAADDGFLETPRSRYLQIAWSTMIGVALLRDDQLLRTIDWRIDRDQAARLIVESVFGLDPRRMGEATRTFLESQGVEPEPDVDAGGSPGAPPMADRALSKMAETSLEYFRPEVSADALAEQPDPESALDPEPEPLSAPVGVPTPESPMPLGEALERFPGLRRAAFSNRMRNRPRILWIDDHPEWIKAEVDTLRHLGAEVVLARTTHEAVRVLAKAAGGHERPVQVIVSDIARGSRLDAGVRALPELARLAPLAPVIFYVADVESDRGVPEGAAGITDRTDELLHLVVDAVEGR